MARELEAVVAARTEPVRVRIICRAGDDTVLLLNWRDPVDAHVFFEPPGGGIEPGETSREAAVRELYEETGLAVALGSSTVLVERRYRWAGVDHHHFEEFFLARLDEPHPIAPAAPTDEELETYLGARFVAPDAFDALEAPVEPVELVAICRVLAAN